MASTTGRRGVVHQVSPPSLLELLAAPPRVERASQGILMQLNFASSNIIAGTPEYQLYGEAVVAARMLREVALATSSCKVALVASERTWAFIQSQPTSRQLWDIHIPFNVTRSRLQLEIMRTQPRATKSIPIRIRESVVHWVWKLATFLLTPFRKTLYLDADVLVLSPTFVSDLLEGSLRIADMAAPVDPNRPGRKIVMSRTGTFHINPPMFGRGIPPLCMGLAAYRLTPAVVRLFNRAAIRLMGRQHARDPTDESKLVRQSDQEMVWFQLMYGRADKELRVFGLPEEYYCPMIPLRGSVFSPATAPAWATSWTRGDRSREYPCHAVHGHYNARTLALANLSHLASSLQASPLRSPRRTASSRRHSG